MNNVPYRIRLSPALRALLATASPNDTVALRALLLIGAHAVGYDLTACRADLGRLLGAAIDEPVRSAIDQIYGLRRTESLPTAYENPTPGLPPAYDQPTPGLPPTYDQPTPDLHHPVPPAAPDLAEPDALLAAIGLEV